MASDFNPAEVAHQLRRVANLCDDTADTLDEHGLPRWTEIAGLWNRMTHLTRAVQLLTAEFAGELHRQKKSARWN